MKFIFIAFLYSLFYCFCSGCSNDRSVTRKEEVELAASPHFSPPESEEGLKAGFPRGGGRAGLGKGGSEWLAG